MDAGEPTTGRLAGKGHVVGSLALVLRHILACGPCSKDLPKLFLG